MEITDICSVARATSDGEVVEAGADVEVVIVSVTVTVGTGSAGVVGGELGSLGADVIGGSEEDGDGEGEDVNEDGPIPVIDDELE